MTIASTFLPWYMMEILTLRTSIFFLVSRIRLLMLKNLTKYASKFIIQKKRKEKSHVTILELVKLIVQDSLFLQTSVTNIIEPISQRNSTTKLSSLNSIHPTITIIIFLYRQKKLSLVSILKTPNLLRTSI